MRFLKQLTKWTSATKRVPAYWLVLTLAVIGSLVVFVGHGATNVFSIEPEDSPSTTLSPLSDATASGGGYVKFESTVSSSTEALHTCYPNPFCNSQGASVILNGFNMKDIGNDTYMTKHASLAQLQKIKNKGFNAVRLAMQWEAFQPNAGTGGFDSAKFSKLQTIITNAKSVGIYVILDPIHGTGRGNCSGTDGHIPAWAQVTTGGICGQRIGAINANAKDYIQKVARDYAQEPTVVAIDLANEIQSINYTDDVGLLSMYNQLINHVRAIDSDKILMIEPQAGERLLSASAIASTIQDKSNLIYSYHDYFGGAYDASGNLMSGCGVDGYASSNSSCGNRNSTDANGEGYVNPAVNKASLEARIQRNLNMLATNGVKLPLFIGEYDICEGLTNAAQWRTDIVGLYKKYNISRTQWTYYNRGSSYPGDPAASNHSATPWTSSSDDTPGPFKSWVDQLL